MAWMPSWWTTRWTIQAFPAQVPASGGKRQSKSPITRKVVTAPGEPHGKRARVRLATGTSQTHAHGEER
jgi:hypothetical protein